MLEGKRHKTLKKSVAYETKRFVGVGGRMYLEMTTIVGMKDLILPHNNCPLTVYYMQQNAPFKTSTCTSFRLPLCIGSLVVRLDKRDNVVIR